MHELLFFFAGGQPFWWGLALVVFAIGLALAFPAVPGAGRIAIELALITGAALVWIAGPPLAGKVYFLWIAIAIAWLILFQPHFATRRLPLLVAKIFLILLAAIFVRFEFPYIGAPQLPSPQDHPVAVIGDSLSAGIAAGETVWPDILRERGWQIENFAVAGARVDGARIRQGSQLQDEHKTVIVMIGGNDLVRRTPPSEFAEHWEALLETVSRRGRTIAIVELPFIPGYREYGKIQRAAAREHEATLIPRRYLARVLAGDGATLDGIHLSDRGHREWAQTLAEFAE